MSRQHADKTNRELIIAIAVAYTTHLGYKVIDPLEDELRHRLGNEGYYDYGYVPLPAVVEVPVVNDDGENEIHHWIIDSTLRNGLQVYPAGKFYKAG